MKNYRFFKNLLACIVMLVLLGVNAYALPKPKVMRNKKDIRPLAALKLKNVEFAFNRADIPAAYYKTLNNVAKLMVDNDAALKLGGYADNKGGYVYNWKLSKARAEAVKAYLVSKGGDESRIAATEYGYTKPVASNHTKAGRQKNRRVEIKFAE
ncbi:OmpA family protein [Mucilaginibacter sp. CSA2-8R]|uniref:OmpA family protein n=1 Tax=Mucilaginibacter sp. CSA2-8R TaxID=3141542 RepID=UPI00315DB7BA